MPEVPEVRIFAESLHKFINTRLTSIKLLSGKYTRKYPKNYKLFTKQLSLKILHIQNKGKFIYITLENGLSIWITLGMTGEVLMKEDKYSRVEFVNDKKQSFYLSDMRNFGTVIFSLKAAELDKKLDSLGDDVMHIKEDVFIKRLRNPKLENKIVAMVLVNQKMISGIGNYLRAEILYKARISPFLKMKDINNRELSILYKTTKSMVRNTYKYLVKHGLYENNFIIYQQKITKKGETVLHKKMEDGRMLWYVDSN